MNDPLERLRKIYDDMCTALETKLKNPESITAADIQAVRAFLKDNGITSMLAEEGPLRRVTDATESLEPDTPQFPFAVPNSVLPADDPVVKAAH